MTSKIIQFTVQLAEFLKALQGVDAANGPVAGSQSFYRGGDIAVYDAGTRQAIELLKNDIDASLATEIWDEGSSRTDPRQRTAELATL